MRKIFGKNILQLVEHFNGLVIFLSDNTNKKIDKRKILCGSNNVDKMTNLDFINIKDRFTFENQLKIQYFFDKTLEIKEYDNSIILPNDNLNGGVYFNNSFVYNTNLHQNSIQNFPEKIQAKEFSDEIVVYVGMLHDVWGHCITDNLKHFWFLFDSKFENLKNIKFVYTTVSSNFTFSDNFISLLKLLNISASQLCKINIPTQFKKIYVPDECFFYNHEILNYQYTKEYLFLINKIKTSISKERINADKIYFSRTKIQNHKDTGENLLEKYFEEKGYLILYPEELTLIDQINYLQQCKYFAATEGSISHNIIFCNKNTEILILRKYKHFINKFQSLLDSLYDYNVTYIDCSKSTLNNKNSPWDGPFFLYVSNHLTDFFKDKKVKFPLLNYIFCYYIYHLPRVFKRKVLNSLRSSK